MRDRALLLVGYVGALRQSEIVALDVGDVDVVDEGLRVTIRRSKRDQEGAGEVVAVGRTGSPTCPAAAYADWIAAAGISTGPVFRRVDRHGRLLGARLGPEAVADMIQGRATRAGLADPKSYSGHSLRAGFATQAAVVKIEERVIMGQTRHRSPTMVRRYIREADIWRHNLAAEIGL